MARPKQKEKSSRPKRLKQTTLFETLSSPPRHYSSDDPGVPTTSQALEPARSLLRRKPLRNDDAASCDDSDSDVNAIRFAPRAKDVIAISDSSSDHALEPEASPQRSPTRKRKKIVETDDEAACEDRGNADTAKPLRRSKRRKGKERCIDDSDDEAQPRRRRLVKGTVRHSPAAEEASEEEDLANEVDEDRILDTRMRKRGKLTAFQINLEKLKRRKEGKLEEASHSSESDAHASDTTSPFAGARPDSDKQDADNSTASDEEDNFIVEDDGTIVAELPIEFSMETHQDLSHQFKKIFQFFVHIAVQPPGERHDFMETQMTAQQYFSVPLQIVRRKLSGLRDSLVASSVWRSDFKRKLSKYPEFNLDDLQFAIPSCDACHLGGRLSTRIGRLSGRPYDRTGFEPEESESDSEHSDESHSSSVAFHLGRFCARRTRVYHQFTHWEHSLFQVVRREVEELRQRKRKKGGKSGFVKVAFSGGKKPPDDLKDADGICDYLDSRKIIDVEWQIIKAMMESARHLEIAAKKGEDLDGS